MPAVTIAALMGFLGVSFGAFGAHWLKPILLANDTTVMWQTAVLYHLLHSVAALWASERRSIVTWLWAVGVLLFSGSLYALALTHLHWLVYVTPMGGIFFLMGWAMLLKSTK